MLNPNFLYSFVFLFTIALYQLQWSNLYPELKFPLLLFLLITIVLNFVFGFFVKKYIITKSRILNYRATGNFLFLKIFFLLSICIVDKLLGDIPTLHIILITFTAFYSVHIFYRFLIEKSWRLLIVYLILFVLACFMVKSRIFIMFNVINYLLVYLYIRNPLKSFKGKLAVVSFSLFLLYGFGYLGNNFKGEFYNDGEFILNIGEATDDFRDSFVPKEFFWTYLYIGSPLANLELNVEANNTLEPSIKNTFLWVTGEFLPDFIQKKIFSVLNATRTDGIQVNDALNVSTVYLSSYRYASWVGLGVMGLFITVLPIIYLNLIKDSQYFMTGLVSLITVYMFLIFDNMFIFSALSFQLLYPLLGRIKILSKKNDE